MVAAVAASLYGKTLGTVGGIHRRFRRGRMAVATLLDNWREAVA